MLRKNTLKFTVVFEGIHWRIKDRDTNKLLGIIYSDKNIALKDAIHLNDNN